LTPQVEELLDSFERLSKVERCELTAEILQRTTALALPLSTEELVVNAGGPFLSLIIKPLRIAELSRDLSRENRVMSSRRGVPLHYGYALRLADLLTPVGIAEDFTLGDLSRIIDDFDEMDMATLSAFHSDISYREWQHEQRGSTQ
jgi:hypothetical protein